MTDFITSRDQWLLEYRKDKESVWVISELSDGSEIYFKDYKVWMEVKSKCEEESLSVEAIRLQYRSHVVRSDLGESDAAYLIRSLQGEVGGITRNYYTVGKIKKRAVYKSRWLLPELIEEEKEKDTLDNCFEEAIIYNHARKPNRKE